MSEAMERQAAVSTRQWSCRTCGGDLALLADLGAQCIGSVFPKPGESVPRVPLRLMRCETCALVQLGDTTAPHLLYTPNYGYKSGINEQMVAHLRGIVGRLVPWIDRGDAVLDIGCNDGTLLRAWGAIPVTRVGYDPIGEPVEDCEIVRDTFRADGRKYKVITSIAMFYDLQDPIAFAKEVRKSLAPGGVWCLEVGYLGSLRAGCWDAICHEHLEYYGLTQIADIAAAAGLHVIGHEFTATNGGSLLVRLAEHGEDMALERTVAREQQWSWGGFADRIDESARQIRHVVESFGECWALGASTKGNTILQMIGADCSLISCALERNPAKLERETPGTHIPIESETELAHHEPDGLLVLPYHFRASIMKRHAKRRSKLIFPLPQVEIVI